MVKREASEILKGLKTCANNNDPDACARCPYGGLADCIAKLNGDAAVMMEALLGMVQDVANACDKGIERPVSPMTELTRPAPTPRKTKLTAAEADFEMLDRMMRGNYYKPAGGGE